MKLDVFKVLDAIHQGMAFAELFKTKKSGKERLALALDKADDFIVMAEGFAGKDFLKQENIQPLVAQWIALGLEIEKQAKAFKALKADPTPAS